MALFLKYRPQTFADLVGQDSVRRTLQNALKAERPSHAYLFAGSRGTGKTSTARIFAKGLNCTNLVDGNPCGKCDFCVGTANGTLVDVIEIDAASNRGIDEIRDLREKIQFAPNLAQRKVYIIDEVHMLTKEAFNALLKTLEEPPDHAFFCLATTEIHKIPETIVSRCQTFLFQRFTLDQLIDRLIKICEQEGVTFEKEALDLIARKAEGGLRDAISLLEQTASEMDQNLTTDNVRESLGIASSQTLTDLYKALEKQDTQAGIELLKSVAMNGQDFRSFGHDFLGFLREQMFKALKEGQEVHFILHAIEEFEKALQRLKTSPIIELPLEIAVINLTQSVSQATPLPPKTVTPPPSVAKPIEGTTASEPEPMPSKSESKAKTEPEPKAKVENSNNNGFVFEDEDPATAPKPPTVEPKTKPEPVSSNSPSDLSPQGISAQMETIAQKAELPVFVKKSFLTTTPEVVGNAVTFNTDSEFHREKLDTPEIVGRIISIINALFNTECQVKFQKKGGTSNSTPQSQAATADDFLNF